MNQSLSVKLSLVSSALALMLFTSNTAQASDDGKKAYEANCQACHQPTGQGLAGAFPPLADNPNLSPAYVVETILKGKSGPLEVKGQKYNAVMPPMQHLSDEDIKDIANYVLGSWGNDLGKVSEDDVKKVRSGAGLGDRSAGKPHAEATAAEVAYKARHRLLMAAKWWSHPEHRRSLKMSSKPLKRYISNAAPVVTVCCVKALRVCR